MEIKIKGIHRVEVAPNYETNRFKQVLFVDLSRA